MSTKIFGDLFLATKINQQKNNNKNCKKILRDGNKMASCCPWGDICHPIATGLVESTPPGTSYAYTLTNHNNFKMFGSQYCLLNIDPRLLTTPKIYSFLANQCQRVPNTPHPHKNNKHQNETGWPRHPL